MDLAVYRLRQMQKVLWEYEVSRRQIFVLLFSFSYFHGQIGFDLYRKTSNISRTLVGNKIVDNSDVVGASPVGAAPTTSSFST